MRCKNCPRTSKSSYRKTAKCWRKWQLCGQCAVKLHPEEFSEAQIKSSTSMPVVKETPTISKGYAWTLKRRARMHTHCLQCNTSLEGRHYNAKYCGNECKRIAYNSRHAYENRKAYFKTWYKNTRIERLAKSYAKNCQLCGRNIHEVNPTKKTIDKFCGHKCMQIYNHMSSKKKEIKDTKVRIPLTKYLDLLRGGHLEQ